MEKQIVRNNLGDRGPIFVIKEFPLVHVTQIKVIGQLRKQEM